MTDNTKNNSNWWQKNKDVIISSLISAVIGYLIGFYLDGFTQISPTVKIVESKVDSLSICINEYRKHSEIAVKHINYMAEDGIKCSVGYNDNLEDHIACAVSNNKYGLVEGDRIYLTNKRSFGRYSQLMMVQITSDSPESKADIFVNKNTLNELGFKGSAIYKGVFQMSFKKIIDSK